MEWQRNGSIPYFGDVHEINQYEASVKAGRG